MEETFGVRLIRLRNTCGLNQGDLAQKAHVRQSLISMLEAGQREGERVQAGTLLAMAQTLGVSMEYLLTGQQPRLRKRTPAHQLQAGVREAAP